MLICPKDSVDLSFKDGVASQGDFFLPFFFYNVFQRMREGTG